MSNRGLAIIEGMPIKKADALGTPAKHFSLLWLKLKSQRTNLSG